MFNYKYPKHLVYLPFILFYNEYRTAFQHIKHIMTNTHAIITFKIRIGL